MKARTVINGVIEKVQARNVERFALMAGFRICSLKEAQLRGGIEGDILFVDCKGADIFKGAIKEAFEKGCPVFVIPISENERKMIVSDKENITGRTTCPFMFKNFCMIVKRCICEDILKKRDLYYGALYIDREKQKVIYKEEWISLQLAEYSILIFLLEHIGMAVSREKINYILPKRKRSSDRNVDTHIKNIRSKLKMEDVIVSVRSVGYRIDEQKFYKWMLL